MRLRFAIVISGRVQGVYYRASAREYCLAHNISGFVRNMSNGDVYLEAEAEQELLTELLEWCRTGPALARVDEVRFHAIPVNGKVGFRIKRF